MMMNISNRSSALNKRMVRLLLDRELRNKYISDQVKIGLRNQLRALRDERGITQAELAEMIGTKQSVISRIERNPLRVGIPVFLDIAEKLDVAFVSRFEAIDTVVEWYDNLTVRKMTPPKSEDILKERARKLVATTVTTPQETVDVFAAGATNADWSKLDLSKMVNRKVTQLGDVESFPRMLTVFDRTSSVLEFRTASSGVAELGLVDVREDEQKQITNKQETYKSIYEPILDFHT